jgi:Domain of unknown function (DUF4288)
VDCIIVQAVNAEEAYQKALHFGEERTYEYVNTKGIRVVNTFRGLRDLFEIMEDLEDGAEIIYELYEDIPIEKIDKMIKKKEALAVFLPRDSADTE